MRTITEQAIQDSFLEEQEPVKKRTLKSDNAPSKKLKTDSRVEQLSFKKMVQGLKMLAAVKEIHEYELVVSLPHNLTGNISITEVSPALTTILEKVANDADADIPQLSEMFKIGQFVSVAVLQVENSKIQLTMMPEAVNPKEILQGSLVQAVVTSEQDHGYTVDLGHGLQGFVSETSLKIGSVQFFTVKSVDERVIQLESKEGICKQPDYSLTPGSLVKITVDDVLDNGFTCKLGTIGGSVFKQECATKKGNARIIFINPITKTIGLSLMSLESIRFQVEFGDVIDAKLVSIQKSGLEFEFNNQKIIVSSAKISDSPMKNVEKHFKIQQEYPIRVIGFDYFSGLVHATSQKSILQLPFISYHQVPIGKVVKAKVTKVSDVGVNVSLNEFIDGFIPKLHLADVILSNHAQKFKVGADFKCQVLSVSPEKKRLILTCKKSFIQSELPILDDIQKAAPEMIVMGVIRAIMDNGCVVIFHNELSAFIPKNEMMHSQDYFVGQALKCRLYSVDTLAKKIKASFRLKDNLKKQKSVFQMTIDKIEQDHLSVSYKGQFSGTVSLVDCFNEMPSNLELTENFAVGQKIDCRMLQEKHFSIKEASNVLEINRKTIGQVVKIDVTGLLVKIAFNKTGKVHLTEISDEFKQNPTLSFQVGQLVECFVKKMSACNKMIDLSLRESLCSFNEAIKDPSIDSIDHIKPDMVVRGYIKTVSDSGCFVSLSNSVVARVKIAELSDSFIRDWKKVYNPGQLVTGIITELSDSKVEMSLKTSLVNPGQKQLTASDLEVDEMHQGTVISLKKYGVFVKLDNSKISGLCHKTEIPDELSNYSEGDVVMVKILSIDDQEKVNLSMKIDVSQISEDDQEMQDALPVVSASFDWDIPQEAPPSELEDSDEEPEKKSSRREKKRLLKEKEFKAQNFELSAIPESSQDYERLLLGSPNSSLIWIRYMAYELQLAEIEKARKVAERALKTISHLEQQEKLNVWIALLNLENAYGNIDSLEKCFKRAVQLNDSKKIYMQTVQMLSKSGKTELAIEYFGQFIKKFRESCKVWVSFGQFYYSLSRFEEARQVMERALKSLPKRKHVKTVLKFAQLEFKNGYTERARNIFEGIISNYPKRVDVWNVYLDLEIKNGQTAAVRRLFERAINCKFSSKKMKFLFKKYLEYEKANGTSQHIEHVKQAALNYVQGIQK